MNRPSSTASNPRRSRDRDFEDDHDDDDQEARHCIGQRDAKTLIEEFLKKVLDGPDKPETSVRVGLFPKVNGEEGSRPIDTFDHDFGDARDTLVRDILDAAVDNTLGHEQGRFRYVVRVSGRPRSTTFTLQCPMRFDANGEASFDDMADHEYAGSGRGARMSAIDQSFLRHQEVFAKMLVSQAREGKSDLREENTQLRARVRELEATLFSQAKEQMRLYEDLVDMQWKRDMQRDALRASAEQSGRVFEMLMNAAPMLLASAFGDSDLARSLSAMLSAAKAGTRDGRPDGRPQVAAMGSGSAEDESMDDLADRLVTIIGRKPNTLPELLKVLDDEAGQVIGVMYARVEARRRARSQASRSAPAEEQTG